MSRSKPSVLVVTAVATTAIAEAVTITEARVIGRRDSEFHTTVIDRPTTTGTVTLRDMVEITESNIEVTMAGAAATEIDRITAAATGIAEGTTADTTVEEAVFRSAFVSDFR